MVYTNFESLCFVMFEIMNKAETQFGADIEAKKAFYDTDPETVYLRELFKVYNHAKENPPEGIVGVGAITYAEEKLIEFQLSKG